MRLKQFIGKVLFRTIGRWPFFPGRQIRALCGKLILAHCGKQVNIHSSVHFSHEVSLGDRSGLGDNNWLHGVVTIGDNVMVGRDVKFFSRNHRTSDVNTPMIFQGFSEIRPILVEDDVWIGDNVIILPGVRVGRGAILGAGSVIREDVPPYAVMMGNPAFVARYRKGAENLSGTDGDQTGIESIRRMDSQGGTPLGPQ